ncbi:Fe-S cluster assembly protein SufD [Demequina sp. SYSU T00039]|uniref:Fe-S cluster assembly protein SufD n=1 Tax=Demequina lignilytica TaxID=3051663 RepID=A0AAW7M5L1_9MICO|nr:MULTISPECIES: Fe-S cluster assembly protein SufD [unclassified Demequina]MDN4479086.1 Fe-S cluster assembly protein SufD [Demequina sp. SYSU T00039-1]MDN4488995.1 Fe-S cluster assembly protein SufD [Demequina sp. SYSU T00039]
MTVTDHTQATADAAHSHGIVPDSSRADRVVSFDVDAFPVPTGREENWRFSAVRDLKPLFADEPADGHLEWSTSDLPAGVTLTEIPVDDAVVRTVRAPGDRASAVAAKHSGGAMVLAIAPNTVVDEPITIDLNGAGGDVRGHLLVEVGTSAEATVVITRTGTARYSELVSVDLCDNAGLNLVLQQQWDADAIHAGEVVARLGRDARLRGTVVTLGGKVVRLNTSAAFAGEGASVDLFGLYFADSGQHQEHQLFVDHAVPKCTSRVTYKGALAGASARSVWIGDVLIRAAAEGTDTYELNRNLVLTDGARADSVPNLEIETGEIEGAGHASATGRFDEEQMFYLRSRGISEEQARKLVVRGFFADLIHEIGVPAVEASLMKQIELELEHVEEEIEDE